MLGESGDLGTSSRYRKRTERERSIPSPSPKLKEALGPRHWWTAHFKKVLDPFWLIPSFNPLPLPSGKLFGDSKSVVTLTSTRLGTLLRLLRRPIPWKAGGHLRKLTASWGLVEQALLGPQKPVRVLIMEFKKKNYKNLLGKAKSLHFWSLIQGSAGPPGGDVGKEKGNSCKRDVRFGSRLRICNFIRLVLVIVYSLFRVPKEQRWVMELNEKWQWKLLRCVPHVLSRLIYRLQWGKICGIWRMS